MITLAMDSIEFSFEGVATHAASYPHLGVNALDAVQLTFAGINSLRQHVKSDVRIHGIVSEGGDAPNIVPDKSACKFYIRSENRDYLNEVTKRVINCAKGAELALDICPMVYVHEKEFLNYADSHKAYDILNKSVKAMVCCALEIYNIEGLLDKIKKAHKNN